MRAAASPPPLKIAALAGRRIDARGSADPHFPLESVPRVEKALEGLFQSENVSVVVSSAACGADLIGLCVAQRLHLRTRIVLPFDIESFRETSVMDRPDGRWGALFDQVLNYSEMHSDVVVLDERVGTEEAYSAATKEILDQVTSMAAASRGKLRPMAVLVWDGRQREPGSASDESALFRRLAFAAGMDVSTIPTV